MHTAAAAVRQIESSIRTARLIDEWASTTDRVEQLDDLAAAVDDWHAWAAGKPIPLHRIARLVEVLRVDDDVQPAASDALESAVERWARTKGLELRPAAPQITPPAPSPDLGIEL